MLTSNVEIGGINWNYRPETNDLGIIEQSFTNNACHLPEDMSSQVMVDIGAHIGAVSVLAAKRGAKVYAYEPGSSNYQVLLANIANNSLDINASHVGIGYREIRKLYLDKYNTGQNSEFVMYPEHDDSMYEYMNMLSLVEVLPARCHFLKLDCEGCEEDVVQTIYAGSYKRVDNIYIEFHTSAKTHLLEALKKIYDVEFLGYGYLCKR